MIQSSTIQSGITSIFLQTVRENNKRLWWSIMFFINLEHHAHQRIVQLFEAHQENLRRPLPRGAK